MRITGGTHKGRVFHFSGREGVRPTTDFAREALFNILNHRFTFEGLECLDLFGGTGAISFELLSRGATTVTCVEKHSAAVAEIRKHAAALGFEKLQLVQADVQKFLQKTAGVYDLIFADPPYHFPLITQIPAWVKECGVLRNEGLLIVEHGADTSFGEMQGLQEHRSYGHVHFTFFSFGKDA